ncbi:MAG: hypothetical protein Q8L48_19475 [Archangium sp.]|nr:hypothetical protein [Archangium sp.]
MAQLRPEHRMDERLAALLEVERGLEARVQQRDAAARAKVEAARALLRAALEGAAPELEDLARAEALADEAAHAQTLAAITREHRAALATFEQVSDERIDELARWALERAIDGGPR